MPDADVEPEPCRDCMTPIPPGYGWCQECETKRKSGRCSCPCHHFDGVDANCGCC